MIIISLFKIALQSILKNKMRSFLTTLGIIIGICSVIVMVAIGTGAQKQIQDQINSLGVNLLTVFPVAFRQGGVSLGGGTGSRLTFDDVDKLKKEATLLSGVSPMSRIGAQVIGGTGNWATSVYGVSPDFLGIRLWTIAEGNPFTDTDVKVYAKVCILGQTVSSNLFGDANPVGQTVRIRNVPVKVIGVLQKKGFSAGGQDQDDLILAPYTTVQFRISNNRYINQILCSSVSPEQMSAAQDEITSIMRQSHKIPEGSDNDFSIMNQTDVINTANQTTGILTAFLASVAGISLLVGGIGIMNIMLVSVTERTREIGIRMAVGARENDILTQFLVEAVVLCLIGGAAGIILGFIIAFVIKIASGIYVVFSIPIIFLAFFFSLFVGVFFGFYPARRAAGLNPIEALRYE